MNTIQSKHLRLYLIRHGETEWSISGQHTGSTDIPLTAHGEQGARELGPYLRHIQFARVLTSPRQRARRTCELAGIGSAAEIEPDLAEWDYGDYEGKRSLDIHTERPDWNIFRDGCPGGEMPAQVSARADRLIARLSALEGNVALFTHGHFGCTLATRWIGLPVVEGQHFSLDPASVSILTHAPRPPAVPVIALWNSVPVSITEGAHSLSRTGHGDSKPVRPR
jgi:broad specificity phosphatase PhoE